MFCKYCGEQISYTSKWCGHCGKEAPPLCRYRKAVRRTEVHNSNAKAADASRKSVESREAGPDSAGDLKSFMANTVAVNEAKSFYDGDTAQVNGPSFYGEATQAGGTAYQRDSGDRTAAEKDLDQTRRAQKGRRRFISVFCCRGSECSESGSLFQSVRRPCRISGRGRCSFGKRKSKEGAG